MIAVPCLKDYQVDPEVGFLVRDTLEKLPDVFLPWMDTAKHCHTLAEEHLLRQTVDSMPLLDHSLLEGQPQHHLAYVLLTYIGASYIWQEGEGGRPSQLPRQLAVPWAGVASHLGLQTCHTYVSVVLASWTIKDPTLPVNIDNMRALCVTPGGKESEWFSLVSAQTEIEGAPGLKAIIRAMKSVVEKDENDVIKALEELEVSIVNVRDRAFARMHDHLTPSTFYHKVHGYFRGWGDRETGSDGLVFEGVDEERPRVAIGGSAAQSPLFQSVDAALRVQHEGKVLHYLTLVRGLMLPAHHDFIRALWDGPDIRRFVAIKGNPALTRAYNACLQALIGLREYHMKAVNKWLVGPSGKKAQVGAGGFHFSLFKSTMNATAKQAL